MLVSGYWILKGKYPYIIQHQVFSILPNMAQTLFQTIGFGSYLGFGYCNLLFPVYPGLGGCKYGYNPICNFS